MKKIKKLSYKILSLIFLILSTGKSIHGQSLLGGSIQFAKGNNPNGEINIYYRGKNITTQNHTIGIPKITYEIPKTNDQTLFHILIYSGVPETVLKKFPNQEEGQNTIDYFKITNDSSYLFYQIELIADETSTAEKPSYHWDITEKRLPDTGQIPDLAVIITYFPDFIKSIKGGNQLELPTIYVDNSSTEFLFGSDENFEEALIMMQLSSLDLNALHAPTKRKTKIDNRRLLIMDTLT